MAGEATVYVQLGAFHKPVKCYVMDMLYEVDLILGEEFLDKHTYKFGFQASDSSHHADPTMILQSEPNRYVLQQKLVKVLHDKFDLLCAANQAWVLSK
jgi:hypothetical protein